MPYRLRKAPGKPLYWVVAQDGTHKSKEPIPLSRAKAQMRALYAAEREQDDKKLRGGAITRDSILQSLFGPAGGAGGYTAEQNAEADRLMGVFSVMNEMINNRRRQLLQRRKIENEEYQAAVAANNQAEANRILRDVIYPSVIRDFQASFNSNRLRQYEQRTINDDLNDEDMRQGDADLFIRLWNADTAAQGGMDAAFIIPDGGVAAAAPAAIPDPDPALASRESTGDPEDNVEGEGLGDFFSGITRRIRGLKQGIRRDYTPSARATIAQYGNGRIVGMTVRRTPLQSYLNKFLNLLSMGAWNKAKAAAKYDDLYHLSLVAMVETGQGVLPILIEKNQVINISPTIQVAPGTQFMNVEFEPGTFTLAEFLANGQQYMGSRYFLYDGFYNNCQDFLISLLRANGIQDVNSEAFIKQPLDELIKKLPWYAHAVSRGLTDAAALADVVIHGQGIKSSASPETMYGSGRYEDVLKAVKGDLIRLRDREVGKFKPKAGRERYDAETEWEERIINAAAQMAGLPEVAKNLTPAQKSAYVRALQRYVSLGRASERRVSAPVSYDKPAPGSSAMPVLIMEKSLSQREEEQSRTNAALAAMAAPLSRALTSTTTRVRPMSAAALAAANLPGNWNPYDMGRAMFDAEYLARHQAQRAFAQDASQEAREEALLMGEHALDRQESALLRRGGPYMNLRPAESYGDDAVPIAAAAAASGYMPSRYGATGVLSTLAGSDEKEADDFVPLAQMAAADAVRPMDAIAALSRMAQAPGMGQAAAAAPAAAAAAAAPMAEADAAAADAAAADALVEQLLAARRESESAAIRAEADAARAAAEERAAMAADAPRDRVTGEGKLRRPRLKKPSGKVVMDFKDFKGEHTGLISLLGEAANKLAKEAKAQASELRTYEHNKARRGLLSKKEKEVADKPKRGRGRPKGSKNKPKGAGLGDILTGIAGVGEKLMSPVLRNLGKVPGLLPPGGQQAINAGLDIAKDVAASIPARSGDDIIVSSLMRKRRGRGEPRKAAMDKLKAALAEKPETEAKADKEIAKITSGKTIREEGIKERVGKKIALSGKGSEKWIQEAVEKPGAFTAQAKRAKMSVQEFADHVLANPTKYKETTRKRAMFAKNMEAMASKKKRQSKKGKEDEDK